MVDLDPSIILSILGDNEEQPTRKVALDTDYMATELVEATARIAKVLLMRWPNWEKPEPDFANQTNTLYEQWIDECRANNWGVRMRALITWITVMRGHQTDYPIFLFNRQMGRSHEVFNYFMSEEHMPPYMALIFYNVFRQALGVSHTRLSQLSQGNFAAFAPLYNEVMTSNVLWEWGARKKQSIRFYGGETNTILGGYDPIFNDHRTGIELFNRKAEARYDIGGGYTTSEIERLTGCSFISADIRRPSLRYYDDDLIIRAMFRHNLNLGIADDAARNTFLDCQDKVEWLPFDVFTDSFPDAASYAFVSTGFVTSTVRPRQDAVEHLRAAGQGLGALATSFHGLMRIIEKAAQGKQVDLFTVQRATGRIYKYKTAFLQWRGGKLTRLVTTDDDMHNIRWTKPALDTIYKAINPENPAYMDFLSLKA